MNENERLAYSKAYAFASAKHSGQYRIGGAPYIVHPLAVAKILEDEGYGIDYLLTALFHDLLEDTDALPQEIEELSNPEVLKCVRLLTKEKNYNMKEYIENIKANKMAFAVKGADRLHNLQSAFVCSEKFKKKYILESAEWFMDFRSDIPPAIKRLADSMKIQDKEVLQVLEQLNKGE